MLMLSMQELLLRQFRCYVTMFCSVIILYTSCLMNDDDHITTASFGNNYVSILTLLNFDTDGLYCV